GVIEVDHDHLAASRRNPIFLGWRRGKREEGDRVDHNESAHCCSNERRWAITCSKVYHFVFGSARIRFASAMSSRVQTGGTTATTRPFASQISTGSSAFVRISVCSQLRTI